MAQEMAIRGTHDCVLKVLLHTIDVERAPRVLDVGAGQGALSAKLKTAGFQVAACDLETENFEVPGVECRPVDGAGIWPYDNNTFDAVLAVEVVEHIDGHAPFFAEAARVLKRDGMLLFTTPNVLSLKSRMRFLLTGMFYSFPPLMLGERAPARQHISPFTLNRYAWMLSQQGLRVHDVRTDKWQRSSMWLAFLFPLIKLNVLLRYGGDVSARFQNSAVALFGRKLIVIAQRQA